MFRIGWVSFVNLICKKRKENYMNYHWCQNGINCSNFEEIMGLEADGRTDQALSD